MGTFQRCVRSSLAYLSKCDQIWGIRGREETRMMLKSVDKLLVLLARTVSLELWGRMPLSRQGMSGRGNELETIQEDDPFKMFGLHGVGTI